MIVPYCLPLHQPYCCCQLLPMATAVGTSYGTGNKIAGEESKISRHRAQSRRQPETRVCPQMRNCRKCIKIVCKEQIPICKDDTIHKLRDVHLERSHDINLENLPTPEELAAFWDGEGGRAIMDQWFSVKIFSHTLGAADMARARARFLSAMIKNCTRSSSTSSYSRMSRANFPTIFYQRLQGGF